MDNLKTLEQLIEQQIDPNGAPGSILAQNHQNILKEVLSKVGKWTGSPYLAKKNPTTFTPGTFSWNNNALNNTNDFNITVSKKTADLNDVGLILQTMVLGDIIQFKDFVGRSVFLTYKSHVSGTDAGSNAIYTITVAGSADNPNYVYQDIETQIAVLSYYKKLVDATPAISTDAGNIAQIGTDGKIYVPQQPSSKSVENRYNNTTELTTSQNQQSDGSIQYVADASGDTTVDSGWAYYEYLGTTVGNLTDYRKLSEQESLDLVLSSGAPPTQNQYNDLTALFAGQGNQTANYYQFVTDASADNTVNSGWAIYQYKGTTVGDLTDYLKIMEAESMDQTPGGVSSDSNNALTAGSDGKPFLDSSSLGGGGTSSVENRFTDISDLLANQNIQTDKGIQYVADASIDSTVNFGFAYYEYLGTINGDLTDYRKLSEQESVEGSGTSGSGQNVYHFGVHPNESWNHLTTDAWWTIVTGQRNFFSGALGDAYSVQCSGSQKQATILAPYDCKIVGFGIAGARGQKELVSFEFIKATATHNGVFPNHHINPVTLYTNQIQLATDQNSKSFNINLVTDTAQINKGEAIFIGIKDFDNIGWGGATIYLIIEKI